MRFKADIQNIRTFTKFTASLSSLGPFAWVQLNNNDVRFTVIPEQGSQVWAVLEIDSVFDSYRVQSLADNVINLEVPLQALHRALRSALNATSASIRLTKRDNTPVLCLTITTSSINGQTSFPIDDQSFGDGTGSMHYPPGTSIDFTNNAVERETIITQDIPIRVLSTDAIDGIHQPRTREPDVHIILPPLVQLKSVSDRFTRLAVAAKASNSAISGLTSVGPRLELSANMHGCLKIGISTDAMDISSTWTGLTNPELDPNQYEGGTIDLENHPSEKMKRLGDKEGKSDEGWAKVRIDGRDWSKVMSVGRLGAGRVIACFCHEHALILYVYMNQGIGSSDGSVLTYYVSSYSA